GLRASARRLSGSSSIARGLALGVIGLLFWVLLFGVLYRVLVHFRGADGIGEVLAAKLLGLILLAFLAILFLSNLITALSSFYLARDLELLLASPIDGVRLYLARLLTTLAQSSWMVGLVMLPILAAYGWVYEGGWRFVGIAALALGGYLVLPAVVGSAVTLVLVNIFPARRARDLLALVTLFGVAALVLLIRLLRPERLARPEGSRSRCEFVVGRVTPRSQWLSREGPANAMIAARGGGAGYFPLALRLSTAAALVGLGSPLHERLYRDGFTRAEEGPD